MIVTVYIDESGTHNSQLMTIGGVVGRLGQFVDFDAKWQRLLRKNELSYFRLKEMKHGQKEFRGWSENKKERFLRDADKIIKRHTLFCFTHMLRTDDYRGVYIAGPRNRKVKLDSMYALCFRACLSFVPEHVIAAFPGQHVEVNFLLESGHKNYGDAERVFDEVKKQGPKHISSALGIIAKGEKEKFPALQGADTMSHIAYTYEQRERPPYSSSKDGEPLRPRVARDTPLSKAPLYRHHLDQKFLQSAREMANLALEKRKEHWNKTNKTSGRLS